MNTNTRNAISPSIILNSYLNEYKEMIRNSQQKVEAMKSLDMLNEVYATYEAMKDSIERFWYVASGIESDRERCISDYKYAREQAARRAARVLDRVKEMRKCGLPVDENVVEVARNELKSFCKETGFKNTRA